MSKPYPVNAELVPEGIKVTSGGRSWTVSVKGFIQWMADRGAPK